MCGRSGGVNAPPGLFNPISFLTIMSNKAKAKAGADEAAGGGSDPAVEFDHAAFRRGIAAIVPGSRPFGSVPAAKMRLEESLQKAVTGLAEVRVARAILEDLKAEKVTGSDVSGAESLLGDELGAFEALIAEAEEGFLSLTGEG